MKTVIYFFFVLIISCNHLNNGSNVNFISWKDFNKKLERNKKDPLLFLEKGPFSFKKYDDFTISLRPRRYVETDLFLSSNKKSALIIFIHGNKYSKYAHMKQASHLSTWGFNCLVLNLPNTDYWLENGKTVASLVRLINLFPEIVRLNKHNNNIYLVGHSFGSSAAVLAAGTKIDIKGLVLLDPAYVHYRVKQALKNTNAPTIILGADLNVFKSRRRPYFYNHIGGEVAEVSVVGATHTDAQLPSIHEVRWGFDLFSGVEQQNVFLVSLVSSLVSLHYNGNLNYAWNNFQVLIKDGKLKNAKIKS